ncbi:DNA replication/repair protein RecF [Enterovirga sp.]|uniref:DNA replication/repair protein RecF n=1 Tax=Enterovirga sp. TaxID=2026350 RepID=UPI002C3556F2|nr:DNA replication/repair protein RecF [Enterovirga sp.]HMO28563.1 DNA replication/repair protein RecF [Enterovirga sp.]
MPSPDPPRILRLTLRDFRNHAALDLAASRGFVALSGENGAGKTNILEALSLFAQGRGLRRAEFADMTRIGAAGFTVSVALGGEGGEHRLGTSFTRVPGGRGERLCRIDGANAPSAAAFAEHLRLVWLTPDLDGLFRGPPGERRRFLDRLVLAVDARHASRVSALERALRARNRLLEESRGGPWLDAAERELAELAVAVAVARRDTAGRLDAELLAQADRASPFPSGRLALAGPFEDLAAGLPALDQEEAYLRELRAGRARDAAAGRALIGPQTSDLLVRHGPRDMPAELCSTGEQKALLLRLVLAHARLTERLSGIAPLLLLDEVAAHLDPVRRSALFGELKGFGSQVWMTGADPGLFAELAGEADLVGIGPSGPLGRPAAFPASSRPLPEELP